MISNILSFLALRQGQKRIYAGKLAEGIEIFEKAIAKNPRYPFLYLHLGQALSLQGDYPSAKEWLQKAMEIYPENPVCPMFLGKILIRSELYSEAIEYLEKSLDMDPSNQLTWGYLALAHMGAGNEAKFDSILEEKGLSENSDLQIQIILTLEKQIRSMQKETSELECPEELEEEITTSSELERPEELEEEITTNSKESPSPQNIHSSSEENNSKIPSKHLSSEESTKEND